MIRSKVRPKSISLNGFTELWAAGTSHWTKGNIKLDQTSVKKIFTYLLKKRYQNKEQKHLLGRTAHETTTEDVYKTNTLHQTA